MGTKNRERRKAKQRRDERRRHQQGSGQRAWQPPSANPAGQVRELVIEAARLAGDPEDFAAGVEAVVLIGLTAGAAVVDGAVAFWLDYLLDRLWDRGWEPADLARIVARKAGAGPAATVLPAALASAGRRPEAAGGGRWVAQLAAIDRPAGGRPAAWPDTVADALAGLGLLLTLPALPRLEGPARRPSAGGAKLQQVRALLAKAESTTFPEEAEALTAKAQQLMARHAIDQAMLDEAAGGRQAVVGCRLGIDDPYAGPKALLLDRISAANRCRAVWSKALGFSTVFGVDTDLELVELLFTSLLVQGTEAMVRASRAGQPRVRSFRQSFLVAYATRIGQRLAEATDTVVAEEAAEHAELFPVLAGRREAVDDAVRDVYGEVSSRGFAASNAAGYYAGRAAADLARLSVGEELTDA
ncbi:MAG TPA: DUF2786 domain-containing protein [Acidimicrobiales bacterium]|nr:DUF2786 domain-containing protein [Acidimicrobiales bacterium]